MYNISFIVIGVMFIGIIVFAYWLMLSNNKDNNKNNDKDDDDDNDEYDEKLSYWHWRHEHWYNDV